MNTCCWRGSIFGALLLAPAFAAYAAPFVSSPIGGGGGTATYKLECGADSVMVGVMGKWGSWLDSLTVLCRKVKADGTLGDSYSKGPTGGTGGTTARSLSCGTGQVVNIVEFGAGSFVSYVVFSCGAWKPATRTVAAPPSDSKNLMWNVIGALAAMNTSTGRFPCPVDGRPAKGFRGKSGFYIDSIAFVCDAVTL